jgi:hypothetical protein
MASIWDEEPTSGNKIILFEEGDEYTGQIKKLGQVYVEKFKKDVPTVTFEDGTEDGKVFEAGLTAFRNSLLRLKPQPGEWIRLVRGANKGSYIDGYSERVTAPADGKPVEKRNEVPAAVNAPKAKPVTTDEPPF